MRRIVFFIACFMLASVQAGTLGFSIRFSANHIALQNTGTEAAYQVSAWTLGPTQQWQALQVQAGNPAYIAPGASIDAERQASAPANALGRADPLLLVLHDQAGGRIAQLAWQHPPPALPSGLATQRQGSQLRIIAEPATSPSARIANSYAIVLPYDGIARLAEPLQADASPPPALHHKWHTGLDWWLETGAGQAGAWLLHERTDGILQLQIVADARLRGQEQVPRWLRWARQYGLLVAALLGTVGALMMLFSLTRLAFHRQHKKP